ncbi:hypothetical protein ACQPYK_23685 [Streptosporangium sp. CA-135522]|uniref:hypothetical protein n=1 Tax=Streptosporangium sp. CA-135522 TaxID=3240072 RepID=UPI003D8E92AC
MGLPWLHPFAGRATALRPVPARTTHHAYSYGRHYQELGPKQLSIAMFFYRLAADHGHADATYRLALIHQAKEEDWAAASLFGRAAAYGRPDAAAEFNDLSQRLVQPPWNAGGVLPLHLITENEEPPKEPPSPAGDPPAELS